MDEELKKCLRCKKSKPLSEFRAFFLKKMKKYYFYSYCKRCQNKITNIRRRKNPVLKKKENEHRLAYYYKNKTKMNKARTERRRKAKIITRMKGVKD